MDSRDGTLIAHNCLSQTWKLKLSLFYALSCVCFVVMCGCSYDCIVCDVVECEVNLIFMVWMQARWNTILGNRAPLGNLPSAIFSSWWHGPLGKVLSWKSDPLGKCVSKPLSTINLESESWICVNHNHVKGGQFEAQHCPRAYECLCKPEECVQSMAFRCVLYSQVCSLCLWVGSALL